MAHHTSAWAVALCLLNGTAYAQESIAVDERRKQATVIRVADDAIRIDGRLLEEVWQDAPAVTDFIQKEPIEGAAPTDRMEVRFAYDNGALYVGARMFSADPSTIQAPLGRRDEIDTQAESMFISLDTYRDRRTAYTFGVSASGVRYDRHYPRDEEETFDNTFEPVWEARTSIDAQGWTAEMWIPLAQLRFSDQLDHIWGLNIGRFIPTLDERVYWVPIPRTERAWASRFGDLSGIHGISRGKRLELLPVVVGSSTMNANRDLANPFDDGRNFVARVGTDLRMGLGPYLTLNATFNPDFGQVEADPAEVNLSAFATRFPEKRPFFTEGAALFNTANQRKFFYSRLIGARPVGPASDDFVDYPQESTILAAGKVSGRLQSRTSVAVLGAVTSEEYARLGNLASGAIAKTRVEPYVTYAVGRLQQEFGQSGSTVAFEVGNTHRQLEKGDPLANLLIRNALTYGGDMYLRLKGGEYELVWGMMGTLLTGEPGALEVRQRAPEHFLQRPDKDYALLDPDMQSMSGFSQTLNFTRLSGRHWLFGVQTVYDTVGHDVTQLGQMSAADGIQPSANVTYRETIPGRVFRNYSIRVSQSNEWNHGWNRQTGLLQTTVNLTWANFWTTSVTAGRNLLTNNATLTRGRPAHADARRLDDERHLRQQPIGANPAHRFVQRGAERSRRENPPRQRNAGFSPGSAVAVVDRTDLRTSDGRAAIRLDARRRPPPHLRQPIRLFVYRPQHGVDGIPVGIHAEAGRQPRRLRRAVCGVRTLLRLRRASGAGKPRADFLRQRWNVDHDAEQWRQDRIRRRGFLHTPQS